MTFTKSEINLCKQIAKYYHRLPDWSWQDCREWLKRKGWRLWGMEEMKAYGRQYEIIIIQFAEINNLDNQTEEHGDTDLEAILKVVLSVLKKEKEE